MVQADPVHVLTTVARLVAEAASLRDIVPRLAVTLRPSIPFERLHVLQLDRAESFVLYVARETGALEIREHRVGDPPTSVDEGPDSRSRILCTVRQGARVHGAVWLTSSVDEAFEPSHQILMDSVVDLLGLAFEHTAIIDREILRRERIDSLRGLLHTMAGALDIRHVFTEISDVVRGGLPHDILVITQWGPDGASFRLYAVAGAETDAELLEPKVLTGDDRLNLNRDAYVIHDAEAEVPDMFAKSDGPVPIHRGRQPRVDVGERIGHHMGCRKRHAVQRALEFLRKRPRRRQAIGLDRTIRLRQFQ